MIRLASIAIAIASAIVVAGCASPASDFDYGSHEPGWRDTGTPTVPISIDRLARYYVDENGDLWDDRGRKYHGAP